MKDFSDEVLFLYGKKFDSNTFVYKLRKKAQKAGEVIVYKALLLYYILMDEKVPFRVKTLIVGGLGYLICPADFIPDFIVGLGFTDDLAALTVVVSQAEAYRTPQIEEKAQKAFQSMRISD